MVYTILTGCNGFSYVYTVLSVLDLLFFFFSSRRRHTRLQGDWSSDVCSSDLRAQDVLDLGLELGGLLVLGELYAYALRAVARGARGRDPRHAAGHGIALRLVDRKSVV